VGSAGLAGSLTEPLCPGKKAVKAGPKIDSAGCNLLVCGTTSEVTARQIDNLLPRYSYEMIQLSGGMLADQNRRDDFSKTVSATCSILLKKNVVLTIAPQQFNGAAGRQAAHQPAAASIVRGLGLFAAEVLAFFKPGNLFLTGGDTADAVLTAAEAGGIRILGEVVAGVVQGALFGGPLEGLPVVTKAGAFGHEDTLVVLHEFWQNTYGVGL